MITSIEIAPSPILKPFVRCYCFREFDAKCHHLIKPLHALEEFYLTFYLNTPSLRLEEPDGKTNDFVNSSANKYVVGLQSHFQGHLYCRGHIRVFSIQFMPTGFYRIFNIPLTSFTNLIFDASDVFNCDLAGLMQQLQEAANFNQMAEHAKKFLLKHFTRSKTEDPYDAMQMITKTICKDAGNKNLNMEQLAYNANMSLKTFERKFLQQIGLPPKLFARIVRFNKVIASKMLTPEKDWTSITYDFGYYDQMHLIKDFKEFANNTPFNFFKNTPPPKEELLIAEEGGM